MITYEEYRALSPEPVNNSTFDKLLIVAVRLLNYETNNFYEYYDFINDGSWRQGKVKEALTLQIDYMNKTKMTTTNEMNNQPTSIQLGSTSISYGTNQSSSNSNTNKKLISDDVLMVLSSTGLLYSGGY